MNDHPGLHDKGQGRTLCWTITLHNPFSKRIAKLTVPDALIQGAA